MRILGIDPGSRKAGFGVIEKSGRKWSYLASGTLRYDTKADFLERLREIYLTMHRLLMEWKPDVVAIESLIYVKNVSSLAKLSQARGAMIAALSSDPNVRIIEYSPTKIKSSITGHGLSDKIGVQKIVSLMLGTKEFDSDDESDALAIALCHALTAQEINPGERTSL